MRVLCIDVPLPKSFGPNAIRNGTVPIIQVGEVYHVVDEVEKTYPPFGPEIYYELAEHPGRIYHSSLFIPLMDGEEEVTEKKQSVVFYQTADN